MQPRLLTLIGILTITVALWSLVRGRIIAGSRGFKSNYYYRDDNPFSFYGFVLISLDWLIYSLSVAALSDATTSSSKRSTVIPFVRAWGCG